VIGLIFKLILGFVVFVAGALVVLNVTDVVNPGTIALHQPDVAPCRRAVEDLHPEYVEVRWVWHQHAYGWGCFYELENGSTGTIAPMPR
jgi:hypothetical protein